jgi:hypothetical protein
MLPNRGSREMMSANAVLTLSEKVFMQIRKRVPILGAPAAFGHRG